MGGCGSPWIALRRSAYENLLIVPKIFDLAGFARIVVWQRLNLVIAPNHGEEIEDKQDDNDTSVHN